MTRILIAEDEERISSFLAKGLQADGFSTDVATTGEEALRLARSGLYGLLVLDLGLPGGLDAVRTLRADGNRLPVVILTPTPRVDDEALGLRGGAIGYVTKPFRLDDLRSRIHQGLRADPLRLGRGRRRPWRVLALAERASDDSARIW